MLIYVLRHGETVANSEGKMQGWLNSPLNEKGRLIAAKTGEGLKKAGIKFDCAFTSTLDRAVETCSLVLENSGNKGIPVYPNDNFREVCAGYWEGEYKPTINGNTVIKMDDFLLYSRDPFTFAKFPGGETVVHSMERSQTELKRIAKLDYDSILISSHGFVTRAMLNFIFDNPGDFWQGCVPKNCSITIVETDGTDFRLVEKDKIFYDEE